MAQDTVALKVNSMDIGSVGQQMLHSLLIAIAITDADQQNGPSFNIARFKACPGCHESLDVVFTSAQMKRGLSRVIATIGICSQVYQFSDIGFGSLFEQVQWRIAVGIGDIPVGNVWSQEINVEAVVVLKTGMQRRFTVGFPSNRPSCPMAHESVECTLRVLFRAIMVQRRIATRSDRLYTRSVLQELLHTG
jgi:hypothetical protein